MYKLFLVIPAVIMAMLTSGQSNPHADPFCMMVNKIYSLDRLTFNAKFSLKQVFEKDTAISYAHVRIKKSGNDIHFLQIIPYNDDKELIFLNDSAWFVDHRRQCMDCIGNSLDDMTYNSMSAFFPFNLYSIDTNINEVEPFWTVKDITASNTVISLDIVQASPDVSDIRVEFTVNSVDNLPVKTLQESAYMHVDKIYQEQVFSEYRFPDEKSISIPDYYYVYDKEIIIHSENDVDHVNDPVEPGGEIILDNLELRDFSGQPVDLPEQGLILLDLWYVGCAPCMKSAPILEELYQEYKSQIHVIGINETDQDPARIALFMDKMNINFPVYLGKKGDIARKVGGSNAYPIFILVDGKTRRIIWHFTGFTEKLKGIIKNEINNDLFGH
jgi:hypothetical protein